MMIIVKITILLTLQLTGTLSNEDYWSQRTNLIKNDKNQAVGATLILTPKEELLNSILMNYKTREYDLGFKDPDSFLAQQHFFKNKQQIEQSKVFGIIKQIPKGSSLHSHDEAIVSQEYLYNLTFKENLYGCLEDNDNKIILHFFSENSVSDSCNWRLISDLRKDVKNFDYFLKSRLNIIRDDPDKYYPTGNDAWLAFQDVFKTITNLIAYRPVFEEFFYQALKELYDDNVRFMEFRGFIVPVYELNGTVYSEKDVIGIYISTLKKFQNDYPDFYGARFIYAPHRGCNNLTMDQYVEIYGKIESAYPEFVAGFDLVGQEDLGEPLVSFIPQLIQLKELGANFYFHAGETNWFGESTDLNLFDAILLNSTRIGHGYALLKHPVAAQMVKDRNIAIEICPISNQVLKLVSDLRNHPGSMMIANGFPIVIAADDPSFWGATGLSYDWYLAFMAMTSRETDLRFLKQIAINSIIYSSLDPDSKNDMLTKWTNDWDKFVNGALKRYYANVFNHVILL